jgi:hypothetical protein
VVEHAIDGIKILLALVMQLLGLRLEVLEPPLRIDVYSIFGVLSNVKLGLELLRCLLMRDLSMPDLPEADDARCRNLL